jgi:hypothetical protein
VVQDVKGRAKAYQVRQLLDVIESMEEGDDHELFRADPLER